MVNCLHLLRVILLVTPVDVDTATCGAVVWSKSLSSVSWLWRTIRSSDIVLLMLAPSCVLFRSTNMCLFARTDGEWASGKSFGYKDYFFTVSHRANAWDIKSDLLVRFRGWYCRGIRNSATAMIDGCYEARLLWKMRMTCLEKEHLHPQWHSIKQQATENQPQTLCARAKAGAGIIYMWNSLFRYLNLTRYSRAVSGWFTVPRRTVTTMKL